MHQVPVNLVSNAVKFTPQGFVEVRAALHGAVTLDEFKDLVRDRGIGPNIPVFGEPPL